MRLPIRGRVQPPLFPPGLDDPITGVPVAPDPSRDPSFALQKLERALVRAHVDAPDAMTEVEVRRLRYLISFARLTAFEPGAAGPQGTRGRGDVDVTEDLAPWRDTVIDKLTGPLRREQDPAKRLAGAREVYHELEEQQTEQRRLLLERRGKDFSAAELDAEVGYKSLALVLGGGGGAGFVYVGAMRRLIESDIEPDYVIGASIGAILGALFARQTPIPFDDYLEFARSLSYRALLGPEPARRKHGLTSVLSLRLDEFAAPLFERPDGDQMRMEDLAIPYDAVVAGVHQQLFSRLPARFRRQEMAMVKLRSLPVIPIGLGPAIVSRLWQAASFIDSRVVKPLVLGDDDLTRQFNVVDAVSFSAAIPGVLHHETKDPRMVPLLDRFLAEKEVAALVDGGAASNVPVEQAWIKVQRGRIGTRNAMYLALDCFHPQWDPRQLWLTPITRAVQLGMVRNAPYADQLLRMSPTLSPVTLAPSPEALDQAVEWGHASMDEAMVFVNRMLEPVWWEGDAPAYADRSGRRARVSMAPPMRPIIAAAQGSRDALRRFRDRHFS
ncbi:MULTISPECIES: patatin-like phospholipase family protein [unclassified Nocardioides]|uniref:patatin-like phospholipase family protein n=1 Tax=unclassified Nocardioides TaxID=2615069 RepID=UPI0009E927E4|nr:MULTISPECIES: patatin-like phospholipase family protein [unclassified Nocardioides]